MSAADDFRRALEADGYTVLRTKSYNAARERQRVAEALLRAEVEHAESVRGWARDCIAEERRLSARCSYLYALAMKHGATAEELRGPIEPTPSEGEGE